MKKILEEGADSSDRTGTGRRRLFGNQIRFNLQEGLPLVTTRQIFTKTMIKELLWFIKGSTDVTEIRKDGFSIWDKWAVSESDIKTFAEENSNGDEAYKAFIVAGMAPGKLNQIGPMYGHTWRNAPQDKFHILWPKIKIEDIPKAKLTEFTAEYEVHCKSDPELASNVDLGDFCVQKYMSTVDQLNDLMLSLRDNPYSARHIVSAWIPSLLPFDKVSPQQNVLMERGSLAPCHTFFQCYVTPPKTEQDKPRLSLKIEVRSNDVPVGAPYNIGQYAILLSMIARVSNMEPYELIYGVGDYHIYLDQVELAKEQVNRIPYAPPTIWLNPEITSIFDFTEDDIRIENYEHHPRIDYPVST